MNYNSLAMRSIAAAVFLALSTFTIAQQPTPPTFPIPTDMHESWPGAKLDYADKHLLRKTVNADLRDLDEESQSGEKAAFSSVDTENIALGTLGRDLFVNLGEQFRKFL